ncbi:MAG TPA: bifunctional oligoribonuclease/PAP phosphatase NrnA [Thermoleophilaceae bacterium]|nr:bifunctional oligoribonuclease/PAP phosphatase NrnA [Thermoleophilaceae bacterium]
MSGVGTELDQVVEELRGADKLLLTTHENPDGDALGSLLGMHGILTQLGKDALMYLSPDEFPLPHEYRDMENRDIIGGPPADMDERVAVFLDCGNIDRMPVDFLQRDGIHILNIDHHHDNTRFGTANLVDSKASCTAEIVWRLSKELGVELTTEIARALYVGLITDTGRFMYENTTSEAHQMAAELIEAGVEPHVIYSRIYESLPFERITLLQRGLATIRRFDGGTITMLHLTAEDFEQTGAVENDSEGIIDHARAVEGTAVAVLVRELTGDRAGKRKVSLRATDGRVDVSEIARSFGGGGHRQAAGATTELDLETLTEAIRERVRAQLAA